MDRRLSSKQCARRQDSRLNGMMKQYFGGMKCLKPFIQYQRFGPRVLPPLQPFHKALEEVRRQTTEVEEAGFAWQAQVL